MIYGWAGCDLEIDLSIGNIEKKRGDRKLYEDYLGGKGTNTKILWDRVPPEVDPFSEDNLLIISAGVLDGTMVPFANRTAITFKSPVMGGFLGYSVVGGYFGPELKYAGYDSIVVSGKSPVPVYLWINDDTIELRDAGHLLGKDTQETQAMLREELNERAQILCIGPAGENKAYGASIEHDTGISASRRGGGTVMGDKKLKAIAVRGTKDINIARPELLYQLCQEINSRSAGLRERWKTFPVLDPTYHLPMGAYGNFKETPPPDVLEAIAKGKEIGEKCKPLKIRRLSCYNCSMACRQIQQTADGRYCGLKCSAHTRSMIAIQIFDGRFNMEFYNLCEKYGLDSLSVQNIVAFVIDLYEKGILTKEDTDGMHLEFRNADVALALVKKMAYREGIGDIMADGTYRAARRIGKGAEEYAVTTKKLECRHDFMFSPPDALAEAISDGGDHHKLASEVKMPPYDYDESQEAEEAYVKSKFWGHPKELEKYFLNRNDGDNYEGMVQWISYIDEVDTLRDSLGICAWCAGWLFTPPITGIAMFADLLSYTTGMDIDETGLRKIAERIQCLGRSYNIREGLRRKDDTIPEFNFRFKPPDYLKIIYGEGIQTVDRSLFNKWIDRFYQLKGWDRKGIPTKDTLEELGLAYISQMT